MAARQRVCRAFKRGGAVIVFTLGACSAEAPADEHSESPPSAPVMATPVGPARGEVPSNAVGPGPAQGPVGMSPQAQAGAEAPAQAVDAPASVPADRVTYHADIRPIIAARCLGCHVDGASGPFPLDSYDKVKGLGGVVVAAVMSRRMPPWLADDTNCTPIIDDQRLTDEQLALFAAWEAADFPEGDAGTYVAPPPPQQRQIGEPDMIIKATRPFQLRGGIEDYFCLQTDARFAEDTWVTAMDLVPENDAYVHHAIVNVGRTCSALGTTSENIFSYRPGSRTLVFEEGDALKVPAGSSIMIQFHYNTRFESRGASLPTDQSAFRIWTLPPGEKPAREVTRMSHHDLVINIPVGAVDKKEGSTQAFGREYARPGAEIIGISPHMHYLGHRFLESVTQGGESICLVDIPEWDQDWQLDYFFEPEHYIPLMSGARAVQECYYNNRPEDQGRDPEGNLFTPRYTTFGEDTRQEMCLGYIWIRYPL